MIKAESTIDNILGPSSYRIACNVKTRIPDDLKVASMEIFIAELIAILSIYMILIQKFCYMLWRLLRRDY